VCLESQGFDLGDDILDEVFGGLGFENDDHAWFRVRLVKSNRALWGKSGRKST
jgi:hypothetical protein